MSKFKHMLSESFVQLGIFVENFGIRISKFGVDLHMYFKTEVGIKVIEMIRKTEIAVKTEMEKQAKAEKLRQQNMMKEYDKQERNKILNMVKGEKDAGQPESKS